jgi:hypothetical protein
LVSRFHEKSSCWTIRRYYPYPFEFFVEQMQCWSLRQHNSALVGDNVVYRDSHFHRVVAPMSGPLLSPTKLNGLHDEEGMNRAQSSPGAAITSLTNVQLVPLKRTIRACFHGTRLSGVTLIFTPGRNNGSCKSLMCVA